MKTNLASSVGKILLSYHIIYLYNTTISIDQGERN